MIILKNNKNNPLGIALEQNMVENEFVRVQNKLNNNKNLTYSEKVFMTIILKFLEQEL